MFRRYFMFVLAVILAAFVFSCSSDDPADPGDGGISADEADDIIRDTVIPSVVPAGTKYVCLGINSALAKGSTVEEYSPDGGDIGLNGVAGVSLAIEEESYFYFLNLDPYAFYTHPVKYVVVNKRSGSYAVTDAEWWPVINGATPSQFLQTVPDAAWIVSSVGDIIRAEGPPMVFDLPVELNPFTGEGFICVQGVMPGEACYADANATYLNGYYFFNAYKNGLSKVVALAENQTPDILSVIDDLVEEGKSMITLYIIAHGNVDLVVLGGYRAYPSHFRNKFASHPDVLFNLILGSCRSGSFIDELQTLPNVRVVMTACAADESAWPDWDIKDGIYDLNIPDSGSEWMSSVLYAANVITMDPTNWSLIADYAGTYRIPMTCQLLYEAHFGAIGQNAEYGLSFNFDLSNKTDYSNPQGYFSWMEPGRGQ